MYHLRNMLALSLVVSLFSLGCDTAVSSSTGSNASEGAGSAKVEKTDDAAPNSANKSDDSKPPKKEPGQPRASVSGPSWEMPDAALVHNFGSVWAGETLRHTFEFKNIGDETLRILEAKPRCSCSVAENYSKVIEPGETGRIPFVLKTTNKHGPVNEYLNIKLNDPQKPQMTIHMRGDVKKVANMTVTFDSRTDPNDRAAMAKLAQTRAFFGPVNQGEEVQRILTIRNTSGVSPLKLELVRINGDKFFGKLEEERPGELWKFFIFSQPPYKIGYNFTQFDFKTNIPQQPTWEIKASLELPPRVKIIPDRIVADENTYKNKSRPIRIMNNGDTPINVLAVACSDPSYKVTYLGPDPTNPKQLTVEVILPPGEYRPPAYGEVVRIDTDDPEKSRIEIMVLPSLRRGATPRPADKPLEFFPGKLLG